MLPNLGQAVQAFGADEREFMTWVALHEVTHAVQFAGVPWLHGHLSGLVRELLRSAELRIDTPRKLRLPSGASSSRIGGALRRGDLISIVTNQAERETLDRVQAVMAVIEGHAEHVMDAVAPDLLPRCRGCGRRSTAGARPSHSFPGCIGRLLGLEMKLSQYERGKFFCDAIVEHGGQDALRHVFSSPEALPSWPRSRTRRPGWARNGLAAGAQRRSTA